MVSRVSTRHGLAIVAAAAVVVACSEDGPPRPAASTPFPMPNPPTSGLPNAQSFLASDGLVLDEVTGLAWQASVDIGPGEAGGFVWQDAVDHCDALAQGGHTDFRLPTRLELVSIVDFSTTDPAIDESAFPNTPSEAYWTRSAFATDPEQSFYVNFFFGYTSTNFRVYSQSVRCVRNASQPALPTDDRFRVDGDTVLDRMTGLRWERSPAFSLSSFEDAAVHCDGLALDGAVGFRAPSMKELQTLVDETRTDVAIDPVAFPGASGDGYWTSTLVAEAPDSAWLVRFSDGYSQYATVDTPNLVRCVR